MELDFGQATAELDAWSALVWSWAVAFLPRLGAALLILLIGFFAAGWASRAVGEVTRRSSRIEPTLRPVIRVVVRYGILILVFVAALGQLGVQTASLLAALGAIGLAIGLAMQGTLSNIAAGIMLLWLRPFEVGDYIEGNGVAGTVEELSLFHTQLKTWDGIFKFVPNSELWNKAITNFTRNPMRLVILDFGISYEDDVAEGRRILLEVAKEHAKVLDDPPPAVVPLALGDSAVVLQMRAWAPNPDFWSIRWELTEEGKKRLEAAGITIPFPQRVVHVVSEAGGKRPVEPAFGG